MKFILVLNTGDANDSERDKKLSKSKHLHLLRALLCLKLSKARYFLDFTNLVLPEFNLKILLCALAGLLNSLGQLILKKSWNTN